MNNDELLRDAVGRHVQEMQRRALDETTVYRDVTARLARLRRAVRRRAGDAPDIWDDTIAVVPEELRGRTDEPSRWESAAHVAITLFAVHAQSMSTAAHEKGVSLGAAVRRLAHSRGDGADERDPAIFHRFQILATAQPGPELLHHLRSMVTLLRSERTPLDYGQLAVDLVDLADPQRANRVRLRWGRDYHRNPRTPEQQTEAPSSN